MIVAFVATKSVSLAVPFCERHHNHWDNRGCGIIFGLLLVLAFALVAFPYGMNEHVADQVIWLAVASVGLLWIVLALRIYLGTVRVVEITDQTVCLAAVHEEFVEAARREQIVRLIAN